MKKITVIRNTDQVSIGNLIHNFLSQVTVFQRKITVYQAVPMGYTKYYQSEKSLRVVNDTLLLGFDDH